MLHMILAKRPRGETKLSLKICCICKLYNFRRAYCNNKLVEDKKNHGMVVTYYSSKFETSVEPDDTKELCILNCLT